MRIAAVVQARMSSRRLPGKVLQPLAGKPLLGYTLERLARCAELTDVIVATSADVSDAPITDYCRSQGVACHRGPLHNVAARFEEVLRAHDLDGFVRICADSPFIDAALVDRALTEFHAADADVVTNVQVRTFPKGQSVEAVRREPFLSACAAMTEPEDQEHVTRFLYRRPEQFSIRNLESGAALGAVNLCVDEPADLTRAEIIVRRMDRPHWTYGMAEIIQLANALEREGLTCRAS